MSPQSARTYRVSLVTAVALAIAYGAQMPLPFLAPIFAFLFALQSEQPFKLKALLGLVVLITITLGMGLMLIPLLQFYPVTGVLLAAVGIYFSAHLIVNKGKMLVGTFFMAGMTMISCLGLISSVVSVSVISAILIAVAIAVVCQWIIYPWFPTPAKPAMPAPSEPAASTDMVKGRAALQTTAIVLPVYLLALTNPTMYLPLIMKSVTLGQQTTTTDMNRAGSELLTSTLAASGLALVLWGLLQIRPNLWVFFLSTLLLCLWVCRQIFTSRHPRFTPAFWQNALVTMFILIGPAVEDTMNGKDPYKASAVRLALFIALSLYAWFAIRVIGHWRDWRHSRRAFKNNSEATC